MHTWNNIIEILQYRALESPSKIAFRFLIDGEHQEEIITYEQLDRKARAIAFQLIEFKKSQSLSSLAALLVYPSGLEFIAAFLGCLYAKVIAIPSPIPRRTRSTSRIKSILEDSQVKLILTDTHTASVIKSNSFASDYIALPWIISDEIQINNFIYFSNFILPQEIAFLQYTSGSTSNPKGVVITHKNIISNQEMIKNACKNNEYTIFVGWLPFYHDMGLIGNILQPLYLGIEATLFSPIAFLQKPLRWLQAISKYKATISGGPNFAYDLCIEKISDEDIKQLDLSSWKIAFNGAEPINFQTLEKFSTKFISSGFELKNFFPVYGLAEATLLVSAPVRDSTLSPIYADRLFLNEHNKIIPPRNEENKCILVSVGKAIAPGKIEIVDHQSLCSLHPFQIGEIWIQGPHAAQCYWNQLENTKYTFKANLTGKEGFFLRTGDLGFLDDKLNLYITGRIKDLIIIRGKNFYPQDIEFSISQIDNAFDSQGIFAFSIQKEEKEKLVVVIEIKRTFTNKINQEMLTKKIQQVILQEHLIAPEEVLFAKQNSLPKTTSGKKQRSLCKKLYLEKQLDPITESNNNVTYVK